MDDNPTLTAKPLKLQCVWEPQPGQWLLVREDDTLGDRIGLRKGSPARDVTITLIPNQPNQTFDRSDPLFASEVACPPPAPRIDTDQIVNVALDSSGTVLEFRNKNSGPGRDIHYQLNFSSGAPYDPMFRNGGGR